MLNIKEGLVIAPNYIKENILKQISKEKKLINIKFMTKEEFIKNYYGSLKPESLYFLMKNFNLNYHTAIKYLNNIFINSKEITPYFLKLKEANLIEINPYFKQNLKNITVISYELDPYLIKSLKKYNLNIIKNEIGNLNPVIHEFQSQTDEIIYTAQSIINKLNNNIDINNIYISGLTEDYKSEFIRIFNLFNIPFNHKPYTLYSSKVVQIFIKTLIKTKDLQTSLDALKDSELKNKIINVLNTLRLPIIDDISLEIITNKLKEITIETKVNNAVQIIDINQINDKTNHYYILGFNQGIIPHINKDDDIITDKEKEKLGILTSLDKNKINQKQIEYIIKTFPHLTISYKLKDTFNTYYPSAIINKLNLNVQKDHQINLTYSNKFNQIYLGIMLDDYFKYNEKNTNLNKLLATYPNINYASYSNEYHHIEKNLLKEYLNNNLTLSYTSLNNYALCPFKFYAKHILKLEPFEETFALLIGNLFHEVLSQMYNDNFNPKEMYYDFLKDKQITPKETFYLDELFKTLNKDIEIIKNQEKHSTYKHHLTETPIEIDKSKDIKITFKGKIDKLSYNDKNAIIIDYKTGSINATLDNINYGLNMQLPTYIYLAQNGLNKYKINGFYLQTLLTNKTLDSKDSEKDIKQNLKLKGYTINDENIISQIDDTYQNSEVISSLKTTKNGFYVNAKLIDRKGIDKLSNLTNENIENAINNILNTNFKINPKRIDNDNISCKYCPFKDLCFVTENDITDLKTVKFKDIIGGEKNA